VLTYKHIAAKLAFYEKSTADILQAFDQHAQLVEPPAVKAPYACKDTDDQAFIDLACQLAAEQAPRLVFLISKDKAVLCMRKRLEKLSVLVSKDRF
jgi:predicted nucleic acid-binding protein